MDQSQISAETLELLCRITGQELQQDELNPLLVFLAALVTVLLGVMLVDRAIADAEKQELQQTLSSFLTLDDQTHELTQQLIAGVQRHQIYIIPNELLKLTMLLSKSEKVLLIGLGYKMAAADGEVDLRESMYLQAIASRLSLSTSEVAVLANGYSLEPDDLEALNTIKDLLVPEQYQLPLLVDIAKQFSTSLSASSQT
ncbi:MULTISPECIES: TerB family tellurite resistance protein [Trichocoleus]|uniref:TerB family tellurite resistance protein n=1 Tax=Trichocoleus desertorum GB2-A4 TaxID=2933944 RepID=A0ABV0J4R3_9CYAN|nr:TerB family tellurite resistance protein [Trichocoleus sp. FACHB-46]MBD1863610.1 TerB family tellurite resistance protein [Trichocoleus sp. FACHB-46]